MIITCPSCSTRFLLDEADMRESGRKVRCARCSHVWHEQAPSQPAELPGSVPPPLVEAAAAETPPVPAPASEEASPSPASITPQLEARVDNSEPAPKSKKPLVWVLAILIVLGLAAGGAAIFMPGQVQKLLGINKPAKPSVVAVPAGWGKAPAAEPAEAIQSATPEDALQNTNSETAPVLMPDDNAIFSDTPEVSSPTPPTE